MKKIPLVNSLDTPPDMGIWVVDPEFLGKVKKCFSSMYHYLDLEEFEEVVIILIKSGYCDGELIEKKKEEIKNG